MKELKKNKQRILNITAKRTMNKHLLCNIKCKKINTQIFACLFFEYKNF